MHMTDRLDVWMPEMEIAVGNLMKNAALADLFTNDGLQSLLLRAGD